MSICRLSVWILCLFFTTPLFASEKTLPTPAELQLAQNWVRNHWNIEPTKQTTTPVGLTVHANHDAVIKETPNELLNISGVEFSRGLYCHAVSKIEVVLPKPGKIFTAMVGISSNPDTRPGKGSVRFSVRVRLSGDAPFRSDVLREGSKPVEVNVDLQGKNTFFISIEDGGDGISHDQSVWGDAKVEFEDGTSMFLDELDLHVPDKGDGSFFSFHYGERFSADFLKECVFAKTAEKIDDNRTQHTLTWTDPKTKLEIRMVGVEYHDFPAVEWTFYYKNNGTEKTPILSKINAADLDLPATGSHEAYLHHNTGSPSRLDDYEPHRSHLHPGARLRFSGTGGRPSDEHWPYFNVANGWRDQDGGTIVVVGWPGQWEGEFSNPQEENRRGTIHFRAGQEQVNLSLLPGEEIRTPLTVLFFWKGDKLRSQNVWRRWFLAHNAPRLGNGEIPPYHWAINTSPYYWEMINATTETQIMFIDKLLERGIFIDYWWMDAGWYYNNGHWDDTGTWEVDKKRFPNGLREVSDHANSKGIKTLVWFEPERVRGGTWLGKEHPEWLLNGDHNKLLNLGNPEALEWLTNHIDGIIKSEGIGLYRQDFNFHPLGNWRRHDESDRQGISENKHISGYLAYWDVLRKRNPDMPIDSCASGGRRNDIETLRRAIILHRTDNYHPIGNQGQSFGIASWTPLFGIGVGGSDYYNFRSMTTPFQNNSFDVRDENFDWAAARKFQADWKRMNKYFHMDYYPLTSYSLSEEVWLAWQYNAYDGNSGIVQVFKRSQSPYDAARLKLHGLNPEATYVFEDFDGRPEIKCTGQELMEKGLPLNIEEKRVALILEYKAISSH